MIHNVEEALGMCLLPPTIRNDKYASVQCLISFSNTLCEGSDKNTF